MRSAPPLLSFLFETVSGWARGHQLLVTEFLHLTWSQNHQVFEHPSTMAQRHAGNRYEWLAHDVQAVTGGPATGAVDFGARGATWFRGNRA